MITTDSYHSNITASCPFLCHQPLALRRELCSGCYVGREEKPSKGLAGGGVLALHFERPWQEGLEPAVRSKTVLDAVVVIVLTRVVCIRSGYKTEQTWTFP